MPPLLPEYLSQPVQVAVQSVPPNDLWPVWVAAAATLIGSALGAALGGLVAYRGTIKANHSLIKRAKLEEALSLITQLDFDTNMISVYIKGLPLGESLDGDEVFDAVKVVNSDVALRLKTVLSLYDDLLYEEVTRFYSELFYYLKLLDDGMEENTKTEILQGIMSCREALHDIRMNLINHLRL
ncbi:hypothetical protein ACQKFL_11305 [Vreelandella titanicae]|uniref:hypothetical protein n=1 Tax=Vreelandella titanicae TaxID=664683 RepID=UPI003D031D7A